MRIEKACLSCMLPLHAWQVALTCTGSHVKLKMLPTPCFNSGATMVVVNLMQYGQSASP
jgi:hypothetical protein